jgi:hypothetical protein
MACDLPDVKVQFQLNAEQLETVTEALVEAEHVAVSDLRLGYVYTANMTGNTVLLGLALSQADTRAMLRSGCALAGFLMGAALGAWVAHRGGCDKVWPPSVTLTLALEWTILGAFAVGWQFLGETQINLPKPMVLIVLSALAVGMQSAAARHFVGGRQRGVPTSQASLAYSARYRVPLTFSPRRLSHHLDGLYWRGSDSGHDASLSGSTFSFVFPIALLTVVLLTARICLKRP